MTIRLGRIAFAVLLVLASNGSFAQKVHVEFNQNVNFAKFKTYAWMESKHPADGLLAERVVEDVDRQLAAKGLKRVGPNQSPDLEVVYNAGVRERTTVEGYDYGYLYAEYLYRQLYGPFWFWPRSPGIWPSEIEKQGNLVVDLVDPSSRDMVWRGIAKDTLSDKSQRNERKLNKAIKKMFKKYPPRKSG